ncbi:MAG: hypothetical protein A2900_00875 [Candidatus Chisholmbacteria bacterium RIFCSPLOWO2_01_FULL_50_28]|uniref:Uncharacterized protein n=1 Tax=Candidatus Chisholmbacteria bacterium RIFCSPHIGHO2_01_FULL_52_32 TaxID=1797591 RepID=A0A1G1VV38_9BACT|nr:MAG: hypothetical protein A2786_05935 [Candidatus Chisholmbacteria bacterium RIFCSPHIGHO2_01_FULL_52_32]OGY19642.1 MAG: hypothetical protein A2900_00875 [Candidatus Chisholmbacteria bacterium RIFCSPLOWO2_01_FULL_50_28]
MKRSQISRPSLSLRHLPAVVSDLRNGQTGSLYKIAKRMAGLLSATSYLLFAIRYTLSPSPAHALNIGSVYPLAGSRTLGDYITPLLRFSIVAAGVISFLIFLAGGVAMISNAGNPKQVEGGKNAITAGIAGLVLVVTAYWIVQIVEVLTGLDLLNPGL